MKQTIKIKSLEVPETSHSVSSEIELRVIDNPDFPSTRMHTENLCEYIEEMTHELQQTALKANQKLLAFLLNAAAQEARFQAGRVHLAK